MAGALVHAWTPDVRMPGEPERAADAGSEVPGPSINIPLRIHNFLLTQNVMSNGYKVRVTRASCIVRATPTCQPKWTCALSAFHPFESATHLSFVLFLVWVGSAPNVQTHFCPHVWLAVGF